MSQRTPKKSDSVMMEIQKPWTGVRGLTSLRRLARSARRERSRFKRLALNGREHCLVVSVRALDGPDPRSSPNRRDPDLHANAIVWAFSKTCHFCSVLVLKRRLEGLMIHLPAPRSAMIAYAWVACGTQHGVPYGGGATPVTRSDHEPPTSVIGRWLSRRPSTPGRRAANES